LRSLDSLVSEPADSAAVPRAFPANLPGSTTQAGHLQKHTLEANLGPQKFARRRTVSPGGFASMRTFTENRTLLNQPNQPMVRIKANSFVRKVRFQTNHPEALEGPLSARFRARLMRDNPCNFNVMQHIGLTLPSRPVPHRTSVKSRNPPENGKVFSFFFEQAVHPTGTSPGGG
jgi:hypothetical protein